MLCEELIHDFREELMGDETRVVVVGYDNATDTFCAPIGMERVVCNLSAWAPHETECDLPCSSTSCRWPGRVRSATVLLKRVMNSP